MNEPPEQNPYTSPAEEGGGQPLKRTYRPALRLFVIPVFLAHLVYWPAFFLGVQLHSDPYGAIAAGMYALIASALAGMAYGVFTGIQLRGGIFGNTPAHSLHPAVYAIGQTVWFVFSVVAPCAVLVGASS